MHALPLQVRCFLPMPWRESANKNVASCVRGISAAFESKLASVGFNLVLVARKLPSLLALAEEIQIAHAAEARVVSFDLIRLDALETVRRHRRHRRWFISPT
ncbi:hypothetical protein NOVOSPHI9U_460001 [Novosphingobium sp. 9U]|nr:hypothetical protein NOVOSPHI9U_460001 [Novosphingobium sp. 9U]